VSWIYKMLKGPFYGSYRGKGGSIPEIDGSATWKELTYKSKSGAMLSALLGTVQENKQKATIVLGHPACKEGKHYFVNSGYANFLMENGYNVLIFDLNGFGKSTCGNFSFHEDIIASGEKAKEIFPDLPMGYHGVAMGAHWATIAFAEIDHRFSFAILESAATSWMEFWAASAKARWMIRFLYPFFPGLRKNSKMIERVKDIKNIQSILFVYSKKDKLTPVSMGEKYKASCKLITDLWTVESAEHANIIGSDEKEQYLEKILDYVHFQQLHFYKKNNF